MLLHCKNFILLLTLLLCLSPCSSASNTATLSSSSQQAYVGVAGPEPYLEIMLVKSY